MAKEHVINWDNAITEAEERYKNKLWTKFGSQGKKEYGLEICDKPFTEESDKILDKIAIENDRIDPNSDTSFDHEEVYRATGEYLTVKRKSG